MNKNRLLIVLILSLFSLASNAQYWSTHINTDAYTMEKSAECLYENNNIVIKTVPGKSYMICFVVYNPKEYFDESFSADYDNHGVIEPDKEEFTYRIIYGPKKYEESSKTGSIIYQGGGESGKIKATSGFFSMFDIDIDLTKLKAANFLNIKYYDKIIKAERIVQINLRGFTKVYNECEAINSLK